MWLGARGTIRELSGQDYHTIDRVMDMCEHKSTHKPWSLAASFIILYGYVQEAQIYPQSTDHM